MILQTTIDAILEAARIEDVVGDFIALKKRGVNLIGLCPFHNEKTPSFNVSPVRGIFKCFGCGKGGNSVHFVMEHEHLDYPAALRYLAKKYNIAVEEDFQKSETYDEDLKAKEALFLINTFAANFYKRYLKESREGKSIGQTYFKERGFTPDTIDKFELGFAPDEWDLFTRQALKEGYTLETAEKAGLSINKDGKIFDRFRGRVIFPIFSLTGRIVGFGARILKKDEKTAKYLNSPETLIYNKSKILYGLNFARKSISASENCYLVEGYTDVISMHQAGIENVVSSSGTSLTEDQVKLLQRYTEHVTLVFDGDAAGVKAAFRGIDMLLQQGLKLKIVLLPDGEDPDSFVRSHGSEQAKAFLQKEAKDFVLFKTNLLQHEAGNDPIKKASLVREIVNTIALIPDLIATATYIKECARLTEISEQILYAELNKLRRKKVKSPVPFPDAPEHVPEVEKVIVTQEITTFAQEKDLVRLLLNYGTDEISFFDHSNPRDIKEEKVNLAQFIYEEVEHDNLVFEDPVCNTIYNICRKCENIEDAINIILSQSENEIREFAIDLMTQKHQLSHNWEEMHHIFTPTEFSLLKQQVINSINSLRLKRVMKMREENREQIKDAANEEKLLSLMQQQLMLDKLQSELSKTLGIVILR